MTASARDALTTPVSFTVLTASKGNASKRLIADAHGRPAPDPAHSLWIAEGHVEHVQVAGLGGLQDLLGRITPKQALVHGIPTGSFPGAMLQLVVAQKYTGVLGTIARTLDCFSYPPGLCLIMFDYDPDPTVQVQVTSAAALLEHMAALWPAFGDVGYLTTTSTRSAIRAKAQPGDWLTPPHGMHIYFLATGDVARFRELLRIKLWCAGLGFCKLATANKDTGVAALLERALVDLTVLSPERLDFVAGAQIAQNAPFYQDRPPPELHAGIVLNLDELPDATDEERQEYALRLEAAKDALRPVQRETVRQTITQQAPTLSAREQEQEIMRRITHAEQDTLAPDHPLYFPSRTITAQELTTRAGKALDGKRLRDPQEPDYGPSQAVLHWNQGNWLINSWAHGILKTYRLAQPAPPPPPDDDMANLIDQVEQETRGRAPGVDACPYENTPAGIVRHTQRDKDRVTTRLTNFTAAILADVLEDDGVETRLFFELGTRLAGQAQTFKIPASQFAGMNWVTEHMGGSAIIMPGMGLKDHARAAIQMLSPEIASRHIYTHIGWRQLDTGWAYLHAGGAVGAEGLLADVAVEPGNALAPYVLRVPETPTAGQAALLASMQMLTVAPPAHRCAPLWCALARAPWNVRSQRASHWRYRHGQECAGGPGAATLGRADGRQKSARVVDLDRECA